MTRLKSRGRWACAFTYVDLLVVLCVIVPACSAGFLGCRTRNGESANRVKCASNLRQIGQAILLYSNDNRGAYPRTRATTAWPSSGDVKPVPVFGTGVAATQPFKDDGPADNDVTAALFLLLRTQDITSDVFNCPMSDGEPDRFDGKAAKDRSNFTDYRKNLTYSYQMPYPGSKAIAAGFKLNNSLGAEYAVAADINPGTTGKGDNVLKPSASSPARDQRLANSNNHDEDGQNILYGDGHVAWESNVFVGVNRDNIYTRAKGSNQAFDAEVNGGDAANPFGGPFDANDSILLPTDD